MTFNRAWPGPVALLAMLMAIASLVSPLGSQAQTPASLDDETMLSLVLPPLPDGSRPGVHMWARADQERGPGGLPTVFVVTLYTKYAGAGPEEHEIVNYLQYANGGWTPARPRDDGTLLEGDWAWISLNLTNLTAAATGQGDNSQYTVNYTASGTYAGSPRELSLEEVYAADLSVVSAAVTSDTSTPTTSTASATAPVATPVPATSSTLTSPAVTAPPRTATPTILYPQASTPSPSTPTLINRSPTAAATAPAAGTSGVTPATPVR